MYLWMNSYSDVIFWFRTFSVFARAFRYHLLSVLFDPQQLVMTATKLRLYHATDSYDIFACFYGRYFVYLCIYIYISFCAVKMLVHIFIVYAVLNHSFRWCQSHAATHCGTSFHSVVSVEALALRGTRTKIYLFQKFTAIEKYKI